MTTSEAIKWFENRKSGSTMPGAVLQDAREQAIKYLEEIETVAT